MDRSKVPAVLSIAGSDSSGGAGIQADLKTFTALGLYGATVITALTAQSTRGVAAVEAVTPAFVLKQIEVVLGDLKVGAVKTGMLASAPVIEAVAQGLSGAAASIPLVCDPVMVATSGDPLLADDAVAVLKRLLLPRALVVTPNLHEAARLLDGGMAGSEAEMAEQGRAIVALGPGAVLMKGGHGTGSDAVDLLVTPAGVARYAAPRIDTPHTHGTGCTLSAAIAAGLAKGLALDAAVGEAKRFLTDALAAGRDRPVGRGRGPVDHLHAIRR